MGPGVCCALLTADPERGLEKFDVWRLMGREERLGSRETSLGVICPNTIDGLQNSVSSCADLSPQGLGVPLHWSASDPRTELELWEVAAVVGSPCPGSWTEFVFSWREDGGRLESQPARKEVHFVQTD